MGDPGAGRERWRHRHRRRARRRVQDGEPQPPELHRALSGRGDRRRRHLARRVHHGRAADRLPQRALLRRSETSEDAPARLRRGRRHRRLRQFVRRADGRRRGALPSPLRRQLPGQRHGGGLGRSRQDFLFSSDRRRHAHRLSRLKDRARRHSRRHHGVGRIRRRRRRGGKAPDRAGRRSVLGKAFARSVPGDHGAKLRHRHPGHGRGWADLLGGRDGRQGRSRHHARPRQGAVPRDRHERLRDDALGEPGAHAHGAQARQGKGGRGDFSQMGPRLRRHRRNHADQAFFGQARRRGHGRPADQGARRRGAGL